MNTDSGANTPEAWPDTVSKATSELNNLLQIIAGASKILAESEGESEPYRTMLRESIERAEKVAGTLAEQAGGTSEHSASRSDLAPFMRANRNASPNSPGATRPKLLVVDDEQMTLTVVKRVLNDAGFDVSTAQSGFECLDQFRDRPVAFSLVLLDLTMPFMDGEETYARLKAIRADIPVVLCTGFIQQDRLDRLMKSGLAGFLRKPVAPDEIVAMVRSTLASVRYAGGINPHAIPIAM